jgi:hypothetical protein
VVKEALLDRHIDAGAAIVSELDRRNQHVTSALWYYYPDAEEWRLLLASPSFESKGSRQSYADVSRLLAEMGASVDGLSVDDVKLVLNNDKFVPLLKKMIHAEGLNKIRMTANRFNGVYVDDMLVYRNE